MAGKAAELAIRLSEDGAAATAAGIDKVASSVDDLGNKAEAAGRAAEKGASGFDSTAEGADELASKGSQAAGAMAGLGDLIGGPFGGAMQAGGIGLQAMADSGDLLNAAMDNSVVATLKAKGAVVAKAIADKGATIATKAMTIAQKALNLAQRASPLGAVVFALGLLAGALILAYKKSDTFRRIVDGAMRVAKKGVDVVVSAFKALGPVVQKVMQLVARAVGFYVGVYVKAFQLGFRLAKATWDGIKAAVGNVVDFITDKAGVIKDKLTGAWETIKSKGVAAFKVLTAPLQAILDLVQKVVDKVSDIHLPSLPHIPGLGRTATLPVVPVATTTTTDAPVSISLTVPATPGTSQTQANAQAQSMMDAIDSRLRAVGRRPVFAR